MDINHSSQKTFISFLWVFLLFNMIFRDLHEFGNANFLKNVLKGEVNGIKITEELMLLGGFLAEIPIIMVLLSRILKNSINRWVNLIAALITFFVLASALPTADMDDIFFFIIESVTIYFIVETAWKLPLKKKLYG